MIQTTMQTYENFAIATVIARDSVELQLARVPVYCDGLMRHSLGLAFSTWAFYINRSFAMLDNFCKNLFSQSLDLKTDQIKHSELASHTWLNCYHPSCLKW